MSQTKYKYIKQGQTTYSVRMVSMKAHCDYNMAVTIHIVGDNNLIWGAIINSTDDPIKLAREKIKSLN